MGSEDEKELFRSSSQMKVNEDFYYVILTNRKIILHKYWQRGWISKKYGAERKAIPLKSISALNYTGEGDWGVVEATTGGGMYTFSGSAGETENLYQNMLPLVGQQPAEKIYIQYEQKPLPPPQPAPLPEKLGWCGWCGSKVQVSKLTGKCTVCGKILCSDCVREDGGRAYCLKHVPLRCDVCGKPIKKIQRCAACGIPLCSSCAYRLKGEKGAYCEKHFYSRKDIV